MAAVEATVDDVTLLAAIIQCEAGNEVYEGQHCSRSVVMNRVRSGGYPSTVHDVIYQKSQFPPAGAGSVANVAAKGPKQSCLQAAQGSIERELTIQAVQPVSDVQVQVMQVL